MGKMVFGALDKILGDSRFNPVNREGPDVSLVVNYFGGRSYYCPFAVRISPITANPMRCLSLH